MRRRTDDLKPPRLGRKEYEELAAGLADATRDFFAGQEPVFMTAELPEKDEMRLARALRKKFGRASFPKGIIRGGRCVSLEWKLNEKGSCHSCGEPFVEAAIVPRFWVRGKLIEHRYASDTRVQICPKCGFEADEPQSEDDLLEILEELDDLGGIEERPQRLPR